MSARRLSVVRRVSRVLLLGTLLTLFGSVLNEVPSVAAHAPRITGVERTWPLSGSDENSVSPKTAVAYCPPGKQVVGGGGYATDVQGLSLTELRPVNNYNGGTRDAYVVTAVENPSGETDDWELSAYAYCADPLPEMFMISRTTSASSSSVQATSVGCPYVLGTGAKINNGSNQVVLQVARPSGPGDLARAQAHEVQGGYAGTWTLTAYAICMRTKPAGYAVVFGLSDDRLSEPQKYASAPCPSGTQLLSAGAAVSDTAPANVSLQQVRADDQWDDVSARAVENIPSTQTWDLVATAICAYY